MGCLDGYFGVFIHRAALVLLDRYLDRSIFSLTTFRLYPVGCYHLGQLRHSGVQRRITDRSCIARLFDE